MAMASKSSARILLLGVILSSTSLFFQNCGKKDSTVDALNNASLGGGPATTLTTSTTLPAGGSAISIFSSSSPSYSPNKINFNYTEMFYEKVLGLGYNGTACAEVIGQSDGACLVSTNFGRLNSNSDWTWSASDMSWRAAAQAKLWQGMQVNQFFKNESGVETKSVHIELQSVAAATTSEIVLFFSQDAAGLHVNNDYSVGAQNYSHVKNGVAGVSFYCIFKEGSGVNNCAATNPNSDLDASGNHRFWNLLPNENTSDGNSTMLTYSNAPGSWAPGVYWSYLFHNNAIVGPVWLNER